MAPINYYDMSRSKNHKYSLRLQLVLHARTQGIHAAARAFGRWLKAELVADGAV